MSILTSPTTTATPVSCFSVDDHRSLGYTGSEGLRGGSDGRGARAAAFTTAGMGARNGKGVRVRIQAPS